MEKNSRQMSLTLVLFAAQVFYALICYYPSVHAMQNDYERIVEHQDTVAVSAIFDLLTMLLDQKDLSILTEIGFEEPNTTCSDTWFYRCLYKFATRKWHKAKDYFLLILDILELYAQRSESSLSATMDEALFLNLLTCAQYLDETYKRYRPAKEKPCVEILHDWTAQLGRLMRETDMYDRRAEGNVFVRCIDRLDRNREGKGKLTREKIEAMAALGVDVRHLLAAHEAALQEGDKSVQHSQTNIDSESSVLSYEDESM